MMTKTTTIAALLLAACAADPQPVAATLTPGGTAGGLAPVEGQTNSEVSLQHSVARDGTNACDMLPADGVCAHACDTAGLASFISPGTCVMFSCTLVDGSRILIGGCN